MSRIRWSESRYRPTHTDESHDPNPADIGIEDHSSAQDHNDVADQKATKRDADIDIGFRPFTDISVQKNK